jgi:hypothetical protein
MQTLLKTAALVGLLGGLAACGETTTEQALYGGGAGFLGAAALDTNVVAGAAAGAAANVLYCDQNPGKCN